MATDDVMAEGDRLRRGGDLSGAEACYRKVLAGAPDSADALAGLAAVLAQGDRLDAALALLERAGACAPHDWERQDRLRAEIYARSGRAAVAIAILRSVIERDPTAREALKELVVGLVATGEPEEAERAVERALGLFPRDPELWALRGMAAAASNDPRRAVNHYSQALALTTEETPRERRLLMRTELADALDMAGETEKALATYRSIIEQDPESRLARLQLGTTLWKRGRFSEAVATLREAVALFPGEHLALYYLADSERMVGALAEAEEHLRAAVARWPECLQCLLALGRVVHDRGRPEEAALILRHVVAGRPDDAEALALFADSRYEIGEHEAARELFERAIRLAPTEVRHLYNFALRERESGRLDRAIALFDRAVELAPHLDRALYFAAVCRVERGEREAALRFLERFLAEDPPFRAIVRADPAFDALKDLAGYRALVGGSLLDFAEPSERVRAALERLASELPQGAGTPAPAGGSAAAIEPRACEGKAGGPGDPDRTPAGAVARLIEAAVRLRGKRRPSKPPRFFFETVRAGSALTLLQRDALDPEGLPVLVGRLTRGEDGSFSSFAA